MRYRRKKIHDNANSTNINYYSRIFDYLNLTPQIALIIMLSLTFSNVIKIMV